MDQSTEGIEDAADLGLPPKSVVRRWLLELDLADKEEKEWREDSKSLWRMYRSKDRKRNSFNILWSNTETLRPAVYNTTPRPDVRRRFKGEDPPSKMAAQMLERGISVSLDSYDFDAVMKAVVLDCLVPGRGIARVRYMPTLDKVESDDQDGVGVGEESDELTYEQAVCEYVHWSDFRHGPGKRWEEVRWVAFRHEMTRAQMIEKFGELGEDVELDSPSDDAISNLDDDRVSELFKTGEVWEVWDKDDKEVLFISKSHKEEPLKTMPDPLGLEGFFPCPPPLYAIEDTGTLIPTSFYELYREQADELNRVSARINKLINGLKLRGVYDSTLGVLSDVMKGDDNDLVPADDVVALMERGGLDKAIWFLPIDMAAKVLQVLEASREAIKQTIYEITGIADILRGSTDPNETLGAQQLKSKWGSLRIQRVQKEVQRFAREIVRMTAEIISEKFDSMMLNKSTDMNIPTAVEAKAQMQQMMMQQMDTSAPPPMPQEQPVTLEQVAELLKSDAMRSYRIDIETDSTIQDIDKLDQQEISGLLRGIVEFLNGMAPLVGVPIEVTKALLLASVRRFRLGIEVEDTLDSIQAQPPMPPEQDPKAEADQARLAQEGEISRQDSEEEMSKLEHERQLEIMRLASTREVEMLKLGFTPEQAGQNMWIDPNQVNSLQTGLQQIQQALQAMAQAQAVQTQQAGQALSSISGPIQQLMFGLQQAFAELNASLEVQSQGIEAMRSELSGDRVHTLIRGDDGQIDAIESSAVIN